jgi:hypothetical protein
VDDNGKEPERSHKQKHQNSNTDGQSDSCGHKEQQGKRKEIMKTCQDEEDVE